MTRQDLISVLSGLEADLRRLGVRSLVLFGSVARNAAEPASDVDLLVEFDGPATFDRYMDLKIFLEETLKRDVDLVTQGGLKPRLRSQVEAEAVRVA